MINSLAIGLALGLIGIGIVAVIVAGVRNVANGKSEFKKISVMLVPVVIFAISYAALGSLGQAGVATMIFMIGAMILSILVTGTRGTFKF